MRTREVIIASVVFAFGVPALANATAIMDFPDNPDLTGKVTVETYAFQRSTPPFNRQCNGQTGSGIVSVTKAVDEMSPHLAQVSAAKKPATVQIDETKPDGTRIAFQFTNAMVSAIKPAGGGGKPTESVSFNYAKVQWVTVGCKIKETARRPDAGTGTTPGSGYGGTPGYRY